MDKNIELLSLIPQCLQNDSLCKRPSLDYGTMSNSKRLSLDSGYAGSSNEENGSNIGVMASIDDHIHPQWVKKYPKKCNF